MRDLELHEKKKLGVVLIELDVQKSIHASDTVKGMKLSWVTVNYGEARYVTVCYLGECRLICQRRQEDTLMASN